jgi:hypothetical protein
MHDDAGFLDGRGMAGDNLVRHRAGKAPLAAFAVEAEQVVAIGFGFAEPQFADGSSVWQKFIHSVSPDSSTALHADILVSAYAIVPELYMVHCSKKKN